MWIEAVKKRGYPSQQRDWQTHGNREQGTGNRVGVFHI